MKTSIHSTFIFFIFLLLSFQVSFAQNNWVALTSGSTVDLTDVYFSDANSGTAVGGVPFTILRTTDGGSSWNEQLNSSTQLSLQGVFFSDANNGVVVGRSGTAFKTTDAGANWSIVGTGITSDLWGLSFSDPNTGTAVSGTGRIIRTTDGGNSWVEQTGVSQEGLNGVFAVDANIIYAVGSGVGAFDGLIIKTTDGGNDWFAQTSGTELPLYDVAFSDANNGLVVGGGGTAEGLILKTTDGGTNWVDVTPGTQPVLSGVCFSDANTAYAVGLTGTILKSVDGGATWNSEVSGTTEFLTDVYFLNSNYGFAAGTEGTILQYGSAVSVENVNLNAADFSLNQNYPNPFNPSTIIQFAIPQSSFVTLEVFNALGEKVNVLVSEELDAGTYNYEWNASNFTSGMYFYRLQTADFIETKKMILMK